MTYSRANPSPRYQQLVGFYKDMHEHGALWQGHGKFEDAKAKEAHLTFAGISLMPHVKTIQALVQQFGIRSVLDYGAGKATFYAKKIFPAADGKSQVALKDFWGVDEIRLYDPGYAPLATLPVGEKFDAVVCTDVMEHIPEEDMDWIIDELFGFANKLVYACIATYPAGSVFPNGENVHVTLKNVRWWVQKFEDRRAALGTKTDYILLIFARHEDPKPVVVTSW